jgi:hypothetical protein
MPAPAPHRLGVGGRSAPGTSDGDVSGVSVPAAGQKGRRTRLTSAASGDRGSDRPGGIAAITWLTCWPQPAQVILPHVLQRTARHMVSSIRW